MRKILITNPNPDILKGNTAIPGTLVFAKRDLSHAMKEDGFAMQVTSKDESKAAIMVPVVISEDEPIMIGDLVFDPKTRLLTRAETSYLPMANETGKKVIVEPNGFSISQLSKLGDPNMDNGSKLHVRICDKCEGDSHVTIDNHEKVTLYLRLEKEAERRERPADLFSGLQKLFKTARNSNTSFGEFLKQMSAALKEESSSDAPKGSVTSFYKLIHSIGNIGKFLANANTSQIEEHAKGYGASLLGYADELRELRTDILMTREEWEEQYFEKYKSNERELQFYKDMCAMQHEVIKNMGEVLGVKED